MIEQILNNEGGKSVREKLNRVIDLLNNLQIMATSYKTLADKPMINNRELDGDVSLEEIGVEDLVQQRITENNQRYYTAEQVSEMIQESINQLEGVNVDLSKYATNDDVDKKYTELYNEVIPKDLTLMEAFDGNIADFEDGRVYFYDIVKDKGTFIYGKQLRQLIGGGSGTTPTSDKEIRQMAFTEGSQEARLTDVRGFDFETSRVTINGVMKYPTIDYIKAGEIAIQFREYKLETGDVVVMEGYFNS